MNNHYVPRKYLRGFCEPGSQRMLWQYDKVRDEFVRVSVDTAANENGFYSDDVEQKLTQLIENPANVVIEKLRTGQAIDDYEAAKLAIYIATMLKRVPAHRAMAKKRLPDLLVETLSEVKELISRARVEGVLSPELEVARLAQADTIGAEFA